MAVEHSNDSQRGVAEGLGAPPSAAVRGAEVRAATSEPSAGHLVATGDAGTAEAAAVSVPVEPREGFSSAEAYAVDGSEAAAVEEQRLRDEWLEVQLAHATDNVSELPRATGHTPTAGSHTNTPQEVCDGVDPR